MRCGPARRNGRSKVCAGSKSPRTCRRNTASSRWVRPTARSRPAFSAEIRRVSTAWNGMPRRPGTTALPHSRPITTGTARAAAICATGMSRARPRVFAVRGLGLAERNREEGAQMGSDTEDRLGHRGVVTRRRVLASSAAVLGGAGVSSVPWRVAFAQGKPYRIGTMQPLSGAAAIIGKTALVGIQMAVDRINKSAGINGWPVELIVADYESKPDVGRRKAQKLVDEDGIDAHVGG